MGIKLNAGCGKNVLVDWVNVDRHPFPAVDVVWDLENGPWPWSEGTVERARFNHSLEHMAKWETVFRELYRVCAAGAKVEIVVPHPRHDDWITDPTHVLRVNAEFMAMLSKENCRRFAEMGAANTPLAEMVGVDFKLTSVQYLLDDAYKGAENDPDLPRMVRERNNVVKEIHLSLEVVK